MTNDVKIKSPLVKLDGLYMQLDKWNSSYTIIHVQVWFLRPVTELSPCFISLQKLKADVDRILSKRKLLLSNALQHVWMTNKIVFIYMVLIKFSFPSTFELEKKNKQKFPTMHTRVKRCPLKTCPRLSRKHVSFKFFFFSYNGFLYKIGSILIKRTSYRWSRTPERFRDEPKRRLRNNQWSK